jgi:putative transposase
VKASKYADAQDAFVITWREAGTSVAEVRRKVGISQAMHLNCKKMRTEQLPTDNAFIKAFNSRLRRECANTLWFLLREDACDQLTRWRRRYNEDRLHSSIENIDLLMLENPTGATSPPDLDQAENSRPEWFKVGWKRTDLSSNLNLMI